jgi:hypothetical protein
VKDEVQQSLFTPSNELQQKLGRILLISDAAHSFGASSKWMFDQVHWQILVHFLFMQ